MECEPAMIQGIKYENRTLLMAMLNVPASQKPVVTTIQCTADVHTSPARAEQIRRLWISKSMALSTSNS
jgi:hypothetical protein